jgi:hypothetical protein
VATDRHDLEHLRRSIAMLSPEAPALSREEAMALLAELQAAERSFRELRDGLRRLLDES